jgi:hypothetical protein
MNVRKNLNVLSCCRVSIDTHDRHDTFTRCRDLKTRHEHDNTTSQTTRGNEQVKP